MLRIMEEAPPGVLGIEMSGKITHADFRDRLVPAAEALLGKGRIKALCVVRSDLGDLTLQALWDDHRFGLEHWGDFSHFALVTDHDWLRLSAAMFAPFLPTRIRVFPLADLALARDWLAHAEA